MNDNKVMIDEVIVRYVFGWFYMKSREEGDFDRIKLITKNGSIFFCELCYQVALTSEEGKHYIKRETYPNLKYIDTHNVKERNKKVFLHYDCIEKYKQSEEHTIVTTVIEE